jgi:hypothetical protein
MKPLDHIILGMLLVAGFAIVLFNQYLRLMFTRILWGRFSIRFIKQYRKLYGEPPFERAINSRLYDHLLNLVISWGKNEISELTAKKIRFSRFGDGCTLRSLIKQKGKPKYFDCKKLEDGGLMYAGYDKDIEGTKIREIYYFINDSYFMGEYYFNYFDTKINIGFVNAFYSLIDFNNNGKENLKSEITINDKQYVRWYQTNDTSVLVKYFKEDDLVKLSLLLGYGNSEIR